MLFESLTDGCNSTRHKAIWKQKLLVYIPKWAFKQTHPNNDARFNQTTWCGEMPFPPEKTTSTKYFNQFLEVQKTTTQDFLCQKEPAPVLGMQPRKEGQRREFAFGSCHKVESFEMPSGLVTHSRRKPLFAANAWVYAQVEAFCSSWWMLQPLSAETLCKVKHRGSCWHVRTFYLPGNFPAHFPPSLEICPECRMPASIIWCVLFGFVVDSWV